ncbi:MAG TPA: tetratricopeptide repeat protein [Bryobacteraceae bacterium]|nr:tetratricopeptide repeat protein [Bryobacteraceae bacterium]
MVSSVLFVTVLAFQTPTAQTANGLRPPPRTTPADPSKSLTPEMRGDVYAARKMYRDAIDAYEEGPKNSAVVANKIGIAYHQLLELNMASRWYQRAIKLNPKYAEAINNLGTVYYAHKSYRRAITQYRRALRLTPDAASILSNLGTAYFARKNYKDAFAMYQKALEIDPDVFERHSSYGVLLQERSVDERAKFHYYLAKTYAKAGKTDLALQYIRKSLEEGFKDRQKYLTDPEFAGLQDNVEFKQMMATEQKVL